MPIIHMTTHDPNDEEYFRIIVAAQQQLLVRKVMDEYNAKKKDEVQIIKCGACLPMDDYAKKRNLD